MSDLMFQCNSSRMCLSELQLQLPSMLPAYVLPGCMQLPLHLYPDNLLSIRRALETRDVSDSPHVLTESVP